MASTTESRERLLRAAAFAARAHRHQLRKDGQTPYVSHVFRVCLTVRHVFRVEDEAALTAALLHDTIEDTATDFDDIEAGFGSEVAAAVQCLTKDMRLREPEREKKYKEELQRAPWQVQVCKLADIHDNLLDSDHFPPHKRARTFHRSRDYMEVLTDPDERVRRAYVIVERLLNELDPRVV